MAGVNSNSKNRPARRVKASVLWSMVRFQLGEAGGAPYVSRSPATDSRASRSVSSQEPGPGAAICGLGSGVACATENSSCSS